MKQLSEIKIGDTFAGTDGVREVCKLKTNILVKEIKKW